MISQDIAQLVVEIAERIRAREKQWAEAEPEVCLVALLNRIKEELSERSAPLRSTVESSFFRTYQEEARQYLKRDSEFLCNLPDYGDMVG